MILYFRRIYLSLPSMYKVPTQFLSSIELKRLRRKDGCGSVVFVASWCCNCSERRELLARNLASWGCRLDLLCRARSSIRRQQGAGLLSLPWPGQHHLLLPRARVRLRPLLDVQPRGSVPDALSQQQRVDLIELMSYKCYTNESQLSLAQGGQHNNGPTIVLSMLAVGPHRC